MPAWLLPAVTTAVSALGAIRSGKQKRPNIGRINSRYMAMRPEGYLTGADERMVAGERARGVGSARRSGALARDAATLQARARGLSGASAASLLTSAGNTEAAGRESAYLAASGLADRLYSGNRDFEREKMFKGWGAELGDAQQQAELAAKRESGMWNSIIGTAPLISNLWGQVGAGGPSSSYLQAYAEGAGGYYNPEVRPR